MVAAAVIGGGASLIGGAIASSGAKSAAETQAASAREAATATERTAAAAEALNRERYAEAQQYLSPYIEREALASGQLMSELGLGPPSEAGAPTYQDTPAYQRLREESLSAVNQGAANVGALYSGSRGEALSEVGAGVESQFYTNYMNMLQNLSNPQSTTNIASMGLNQGTAIGQQNIAAQQLVNQQQGQAASAIAAGQTASGAAYADAFGGITQLAGAYLGQPKTPDGGTGFGGYSQTTPYTTPGYGDYSNAYDYSRYV